MIYQVIHGEKTRTCYHCFKTQRMKMHASKQSASKQPQKEPTDAQ